MIFPALQNPVQYTSADISALMLFITFIGLAILIGWFIREEGKHRYTPHTPHTH